MNIWLLTTEFPPYFGGGIATYCNITTQLWTSHGHNVTVFVVDDTQDHMSITTDNRVRIVRFPNHSSKDLETLGYTARLSYHYAAWVEYFIQHDAPPDIIESQEYLGIAAHLLQRKRTLDPLFMNIPVVITAHSPKFILDPIERAPVYKFPDYWTGEMERFTLKAADAVICPSDYLKTTLQQELGSLNGVVIPNPYILPNRVGTEPGKHLLYVGRMQYLKGILMLLDTLSTLWDEGFPYPLDVVGGDSYFHPRREMMKTYIEKRYRSYIDKGLLILHGRVKPQALSDFYVHAKAVIIPSLFENFPYVAVEAMAHQTTTLASHSGGQRDLIISGVNGFLFTPPSLAQNLKDIISLSNAQLKAIGERARQDIARITNPEHIYNQKMAYFERVLKMPRTIHHFPFIRQPGQQPSGVSSLPFSQNEVRGKNKQDSLTVVIPYYNLGTYLLETLDSLQAVEDVSLHVLVIDDGSNDGISIATLYRAQTDYANVRVIRKPNEGLAATRNFGAKLVDSPFLAFLDADDRVDPRYYRRAIDILKHYDNVSFVGAWAKYFGHADGIWPTWNPEPPYALYHNPLNTSALVYKTSHFLAYGLNDVAMEYGMEDYESMVRLLSHGCQGVVIPEPYFLYRVRKDSMSRGFNVDNLNLLYQWVMEKNPAFFAQYQKDLILLLNANGPQYLMDNPTWPTKVNDITEQR
ncbi:MAG: hypothetical protein C7B47_10825 [Sulfobacillus thermosulfidooxidans]|uniref:Uncharacterized protein n=1 Tax=Sulfobacillus thermosulfidooxidans TaxID=28034 RepID=A0A2T2WW06_SULTH|nr:MAG: hypothetical protein C7B47_10825 [Sulfobacillus thermosulfidooxidans]